MDFVKEAFPLLINNLKTHLQYYTGREGLAEAYSYALLPPGKGFRPLLAAASFEDFHGKALEKLADPRSDLSKLCSSVEIHHAYTLIHDDLPCMDDDDQRRGKPSLHRAYGEWQAVLTGDGLLNTSYALLAELQTPLANTLRKAYAWALGPKGLIHGQYLDLSGEGHQPFSQLLTTHQLKTARLIQTAISTGYLLGLTQWGPKEKAMALKLYRLGHHLGIVFQLLDDLSEFTENLSPHEREVNPWPCYYKLSLQQLKKGLTFLFREGMSGPTLGPVYLEYFKKIKSLIVKNRPQAEGRLQQSLGPVIAIFE